MAQKKRWKSLQAKRFVRRDRGGRIIHKDTTVDIEEKSRSVIIPPDKKDGDPYGIPIDVKLAINLISDFHSLLGDRLLERFIDGNTVSYNFADEKDQAFYIKEVNGLVDILRRSCAITIDKNVLLKTLSQPECEGLRFYLCKKNTKAGNGENNEFLSLVTVGVDKNGKDHLYSYIPSSGKRTSNLETMSLASEYGHPPGSTIINDKSLKDVYDAEPYVLLNYALDLTEEKRKKKKTTATAKTNKKKK